MPQISNLTEVSLSPRISSSFCVYQDTQFSRHHKAQRYTSGPRHYVFARKTWKRSVWILRRTHHLQRCVHPQLSSTAPWRTCWGLTCPNHFSHIGRRAIEDSVFCLGRHGNLKGAALQKFDAVLARWHDQNRCRCSLRSCQIIGPNLRPQRWALALGEGCALGVLGILIAELISNPVLVFSLADGGDLEIHICTFLRSCFISN